MKKILNALVICFVGAMAAGCAAIEGVGGRVLDTTAQTQEVIDKGVDRVDEQLATVARSRLERAEKRSDFINAIGRDADDALLGTLAEREQRMVNFAASMCSRSETGQMTYSTASGIEITIACKNGSAN